VAVVLVRDRLCLQQGRPRSTVPRVGGSRAVARWARATMVLAKRMADGGVGPSEGNSESAVKPCLAQRDSL